MVFKANEELKNGKYDEIKGKSIFEVQIHQNIAGLN